MKLSHVIRTLLKYGYCIQSRDSTYNVKFPNGNVLSIQGLSQLKLLAEHVDKEWNFTGEN